MAYRFGIFTIGLCLCGLAAAGNDFPDFLKEKVETPDTLDAPVGTLIARSLDIGDKPCQISFDMIEKVAGKCVQLAPGSRGCMAGSYINPFHHQCLLKR